MTDLGLIPNRILVPVDDSHESRRAIPLAEALAEPFAAEIRTVTVAGARETTAADVTLHGDAVEELCRYAASQHGTMLCMASHGRGGLGRRLVGSTTEALIRTSAVPVVVAGPNIEGPAVSPRTLVAGLAWPPEPDRLVDLVSAWAPALRATVDLVHVHSPSAPELYVERLTGRRAPTDPDLGSYSRRLRAEHIAVTQHQVTARDPVRGLLAIAAGAGPRTMLAVETHADGTTDGHRDVTYQLIRQGSCPVLATSGLR